MAIRRRKMMVASPMWTMMGWSQSQTWSRWSRADSGVTSMMESAAGWTRLLTKSKKRLMARTIVKPGGISNPSSRGVGMVGSAIGELAMAAPWNTAMSTHLIAAARYRSRQAKEPS